MGLVEGERERELKRIRERKKERGRERRRGNLLVSLGFISSQAREGQGAFPK